MKLTAFIFALLICLPLQALVNGVETTDFPGVVKISLAEFPKSTHCTGSFIGPSLVVTAAHCFVVKQEIRPLETIYLNHRPYKVLDVAIHPEFVEAEDLNYEHDLAIIKLNDHSVIETIPLSHSLPRTSDKAIIVGFGSSMCKVDGSYNSGGKKIAGIASISNIGRLGMEVLTREFSSEAELDYDTSIRTCHGDSGGPLLNSSGELIGIVSRGGISRLKYPDGTRSYQFTSLFTNILESSNKAFIEMMLK